MKVGIVRYISWIKLIGYKRTMNKQCHIIDTQVDEKKDVSAPQ